MRGRAIHRNHPLRNAQWIWPDCSAYLHNCFARFRHDFILEAVPEKAPLFITADKSYRLYINGRYVCRGPARGFQSHWPFDEVDVRRHLKPGRNWLSVEAYNPGASSFHYIHQSRAGLLCAAEWEGASIRSNDKDGTWKFGRSPGHIVDTDMLSRQLEFQEHFDAALEDDAWIFDPDFNESLQFISRGICKWGTSTPFGQPPYDSVEPRGLPMLREEIAIPETMPLMASGAAMPGWSNTTNPAWHFFLNELPGIEGWLPASNLRSRRAESFFELELPPSGEGSFTILTFDLGRNTPGTLIVEAEGAAGGETMDFHYHQLLENGQPVFQKPHESLIAMASRLRLAKGRSRREFYHVMGVRAFSMVVYASTLPLTVRLSWRTALYPFSMEGDFNCSDQVFNQIHAICRRTQEVCALDSYVDTPWREQAQWWGDARVQIRNTIYLDGDMRLAERGIRSIAGQPAPHGLTYAHTPTCAGGCILPDFCLTWIMTIWDFYWQTGSLAPFRQQHPRIKKIFRYFEDTRTLGGMLPYDSRFWLFEDWCSIPKEPIPAFLNLWHLYTLSHYEKLLAASGLKKEASDTAARISMLRRTLVEKLFNSESGLFEACLALDGRPLGEPSVHDQVLALLLDLKPDARKSMLEKRLLPFVRGEKLSCATPSAFWATYLFECLDTLGHAADALKFIRERWAPMIPCGTTWEGFDFLEPEGSSCSHAWSAHPSYHLVNMLAGLRQTGLAWSHAEWRPCLPSGIDHVEASIPTPKGRLAAAWKADARSGRLVVPPGMEVCVRLPCIPMRILKEGTWILSQGRNPYALLEST